MVLQPKPLLGHLVRVGVGSGSGLALGLGLELVVGLEG